MDVPIPYFESGATLCVATLLRPRPSETAGAKPTAEEPEAKPPPPICPGAVGGATTVAITTAGATGIATAKALPGAAPSGTWQSEREGWYRG